MQGLNASFIFNSTSLASGAIWNSGELAPSLVLMLCCLVGLPSNIAVVITIAQMRKSNLDFILKLMLNLAVSDILSLLTLPAVIYSLLCGWTLGVWMCSISSYMVYCSSYASVLTVTLMSVHHYRVMKLKIPNKKLQERLQARRMSALLVVLWALACTLASPTIFTRDVVSKRGWPRCQRSMQSDWGKVAVLLHETLSGFIIPFSILVTSYFCLHKKVAHRLPQTARRQRMTKLVTCIVVAFFIFWIPLHVINVVDIATTLTKNSHPSAYNQLKAFRRVAGDVVKTLTFINPCLNPFLYDLASNKICNNGRNNFV